MKSIEQIEQSLRKLQVEASDEKSERTRRDLIGAQARQREKVPISRRRSFRRVIVTVSTRKIAATVTLAVLLLAALGVGTGSVAFSQASHAVNSTLAWLRQAVVGLAPGEPRAEAPALPTALHTAGEKTSDLGGKVITYVACFFVVPEGETDLWQSLKNRGIELVAVSTDPEVSYAMLTPEHRESLEASLTLRCLSAPRVTVGAGETATLAMTDSHPQKGRQGFALGLRPMVSSDGKEVQSTISFHDGHNGFEIPNVSTEPGGAILIRASGIFSGPGPAHSGSEETLVHVQVDVR